MNYFNFSGFDEWPFSTPSFTACSYRPDIDYEEKDGAAIISVSVPGLKVDGLTINTKKNILTVDYDAPKKSDIFKDFTLNFKVYDTWEVDKITAEYETGILRITVPFNKIGENIIPVTFK